MAGPGSEISGIRLFGSSGQVISSPDAQERAPIIASRFIQRQRKHFKVNKGAQSHRGASLYSVAELSVSSADAAGIFGDYERADSLTLSE